MSTVDGKQPCAYCGHDLRWHTDGSCDCEGAGDAGLCPCPRPEEPRAERCAHAIELGLTCNWTERWHTERSGHPFTPEAR